MEQRDDVINSLYTQISELKERSQLTFRDDVFNGGLSGSPATIGITGQRLQYSESPAKFSSSNGSQVEVTTTLLIINWLVRVLAVGG